MQCVEGKSEWKNSAKRKPKQKTISNSNSISILGIPSTDLRHNGKCNICAFHGDWIFVRLSRLVLASEWITKRHTFIVEDRCCEGCIHTPSVWTMIHWLEPLILSLKSAFSLRKDIPLLIISFTGIYDHPSYCQ